MTTTEARAVDERSLRGRQLRVCCVSKLVSLPCVRTYVCYFINLRTGQCCMGRGLKDPLRELMWETRPLDVNLSVSLARTSYLPLPCHSLKSALGVGAKYPFIESMGSRAVSESCS